MLNKITKIEMINSPFSNEKTPPKMSALIQGFCEDNSVQFLKYAQRHGMCKRGQSVANQLNKWFTK